MVRICLFMPDKLLIKIYLFVGLLFPTTFIYAQLSPADTLFREGERLRIAYEFERAREAYTRAMGFSNDSLFIARARQKRVLCDNGLILGKYVVIPHVLGRTVVPAADLPLYYDLAPSGFWALTPESLLALVNDNGSHPHPLFYRPTLERMVFAAGDTTLNSALDIFMIRRKDTMARDSVFWEPPVRLGSQVNSPGNEQFPVLSADGKTLYFTSDGLPGMGGMSLYMSRWNEDTQNWDIAQNMGIPFSSTSNDMLYMLSDDSRYFYFASDRAAPEDSLVLYKAAYESSPVKVRPASVAELREIASLPLSVAEKEASLKNHDQEASPAGDTVQSKDNGRAVPDSVLQKTQQATQHYAELVKTVRDLTARVREYEKKLDSMRVLYQSLSREEDRQGVANSIREEEFNMMDLQETLRYTRRSARDIEDMFLSYGVLPPLAEPAANTVAIAKDTTGPTRFHPEKQRYVSLQNHVFLAPVPEIPAIDLTFRIGEKSEIVPWENEPMGLYYRIQLFTVTRKVTLDQLKGISPVFEVPVGNRYVYYAGQFYSYEDALKALSTIRRQGIRGAIPVAFFRGESISVQEGRRREAENRTAPEGTGIYQVFLGSGEIPSGLVSLVGELSDKDIMKVVTETRTDYFIGPFSTLSQAENLVSALKEKGFSGVEVQPVTN